MDRIRKFSVEIFEHIWIRFLGYQETWAFFFFKGAEFKKKQ